MAAGVALMGVWSCCGLAVAKPLPAPPSAAFVVAAPWVRSVSSLHAVAGAKRPAQGAAGGADAAQATARGANAARGLIAAGLSFLTAATWCGAAVRGRRGAGRIAMRGRNYETNIKKKKGPAEAKKARITRKHLNKIIMAVRESGPDPDVNTSLDRAIRDAMKENVPRSTVDNRIKKYVSDKEVINEVSIGGYGAGGAAVMVQCVTDNTNRLRTEVREAFKEAGGSVGNDGCVDHLFNKQGVIRFEGVDEEALVEASMEADAEDCVTKEDGVTEVFTLPENLQSTVQAIAAQGLEPIDSDIVFKPLQDATLNEGGVYGMKHLIHLLEDIDDVQDVHHNGLLNDDVELKYNAYGYAITYEKALKQK